MGWRRWLLFVSDIFLQLFVLTIAQEEFLEKYCNYDYQGTYTGNSAFRRNLDDVPSSFTSNATFYNFSVGRNPDKVNVIALCRDDVSPDECRSCLNRSNSMLRELCPKEKESIGWLDNCMFRYSDRAIFHSMTTLPNADVSNTEMAPDVNQFNKVVRALLDSLRVKAARGSSILKLAAGNMDGPDNKKIFGLVQCTPDLSERQCNECLNFTISNLPKCCNGRIGGRTLTPSCHFRYEIGSFYLGTPVDVPPQSDAPPGDNESPPPPPPSSTGYLLIY